MTSLPGMQWDYTGSPDMLARGGSAVRFLGPEATVGVSRQDI